MIWFKPSDPSIRNHTNIIGPNDPPTTLAPNRWKTKSSTKIVSTRPITSELPGMIMPSSPFTPLRPSIAEVTDIGGVMIPSASNVPAPIMAGNISFLPYRRTRA